MTLGAAMVSPWIAIPICGIGMLLSAGYTLALQRDQVPIARRRVRTASGVLHIIILALLAYGSSIVTAADRKLFVMTWFMVAALSLVAIMLAVVDVGINLKEAASARKRHAAESAEALARDLLEAKRKHDGSGV